jgi:hypothetical protein
MSGFEMMQAVSWLQHVELRAQASAAAGRELARAQERRRQAPAAASAASAAFAVVTPGQQPQSARRADGEPRSA